MTKVTKDQIILAARDLFRDRGFAGTSMGDLADVVGLRKASLYNHFASKEDLVGSALHLTATELEALPASTGNWRTDYCAAVDHIVRYLSDSNRCVGLHLLYGADTAITREKVAAFFVRLASLFVAILKKGMSAKRAREFAEDTISALEGATLWLAMRNDAAPIQRAAAELKRRVSLPA